MDISPEEILPGGNQADGNQFNEKNSNSGKFYFFI